MSINELKDDNLANARRKLKKYRDVNVHQSDGLSSSKSTIRVEQLSNNDDECRSLEEYLFDRSISPFDMIDPSSLSNDSSLRLRSDHSNEDPTEIHIQTIGILVAEKSDLTAKLNQSLKQLERKQCEIDELFGRLKASRERIQQLEKDFLDSTSNIHKRELSVKESEKENIQLKIENIRLSQMIEDLKRKSDENRSSVNNQLDKVHRENSSQTDELLRESIDRLASNSNPLNELKEENSLLKTRIIELEHLILQLQSETETIGDYIRLYQEQRQQLQKKYEEKDLLIEQLNEENQILKKQISSLVLRHSSESRERFHLSSIDFDDESIERKAFSTEHSFHRCSTCQGEIHFI